MSDTYFFRSLPRRAGEAARTVLAFFSPNICPFCNLPIGLTEYYCRSCKERIPSADSRELPQNIDRIYVCTEYSGRVRAAVLRMKRGRNRFAADAFGLMLAECIGADAADFDMITYIPTRFGRSTKLGGEHSRRIARGISVRAFVPLKCTLRALKGKSQQKSLTREQRFENARNMFETVDPEYIAGKNILLVDDVVTTGATLGSAAEQLRKAGAAGVSAAVFATTPYNRNERYNDENI